MIAGETIGAVKCALRVTIGDFDSEIADLIEAAKRELESAGVQKIDEKDPLTLQSIKFYARANFEVGNPAERELYQKRFAQLRDTMALCGLYGNETEESGNDDGGKDQADPTGDGEGNG